MRMCARCAVTLLPMIYLLCGCDDAPAPSTRAAPSGAQASTRSGIVVTTVAPLLPARLTHVAVDRSGNIYWTQEGQGDGANRVFAVDSTGVPRATALSSDTVLSAMNAPSSATGSLQSIAAGTDDQIYFYFTGGSGATILAALGRLEPATGKIQILATTSDLRRASGMSADLALARGDLIPVRDGKQIWFWLRHSDHSVLFCFDVPAANDATFSLTKPFDHVTLEHSESTTQSAEPSILPLTSESQLLGPGDDGALLLLDIPASMLRRIDTETGIARDVASLTALPRGLSQPAADPRPDAPAGRILLFASDTDHLPAHSIEQAAEVPLVERVSFPALLILDPPRDVGVINGSLIQTRSGYPVAQMALQQLVHTTENAWIAYDAGSGELLRIQQ